MKLTIDLNTDNAAFGDDPAEATRVIAEGMIQVEQLYGSPGSVGLRDINGNRVGQIKVTE